MSESQQKTVEYEVKNQIDLPYPEKERRKAIRTNDWNRCKRLIGNLNIPTKRLTKLYSTFLGTGISSFVNLIVIWGSNDINVGIKSLYSCTGVFSFILSYVFYRMAEENDEPLLNGCDEIIQDMNEIEDTFTDL